jgi:ribonuclease P/MRP protein subunit POP5
MTNQPGWPKTDCGARMKHLPKHIRPRYRYLAVTFETSPDSQFGRRELQGALWECSRALLGDTGSAQLDLRVLGVDKARAEGSAVVRCRRAEVDRARAVITCLSAVSGTPMRPTVRGVSGTVRGCEEKYLSRATGVSKERTVAFANADRRAVSRAARVDVRVGGGYVGATNLDIQP